MSRAGIRDSMTFPHGFLDFLSLSQGRRRHVGDYALEPEGLDRFNQALHRLSPEAPVMTMDQIATAAERALARHRDGATPPFVQSRMAALVRLETMAADPAWDANAELRQQVAVLQEYRQETGDLIPDRQPVIGLLDDAVLIDVALQLLHSELGDYEDFCRFRKVAAEFAGVSESDIGLTREHWLEAMMHADINLSRIDASIKARYVPDPRASLFHVT